jgi:hypothetical protein
VHLLEFGSTQSGSPKKYPVFWILSVIGLVITVALSSTLAANISLNGGGNVEFGQGVAQTTACDSNVVLTPTSTFVNSEGGGDFLFTSVTVSDISESCFGKIFTIKAYKNGENAPLDLYRTGFNGGPYTSYSEIQINNFGGNFTLENAGLLSDDITSTDSDNFTVTFVTEGPPPSEALASALDVDRITIESRDAGPQTQYSFSTSSNGASFNSAAYQWGQTVTIPEGKTGELVSVSNIRLQIYCSGTNTTITSYLKIYDSVGGTLLGSSSTPLSISDCTGPGFSDESIFDIQLDVPLQVTAQQQYYVELQKVTPWFGNFYFGQDMMNPYSGGIAYIDREAAVGSDLQMTLNLLVN